MPQVADFWSSLLTWPAVVATVVAGVVIAVLTFMLNRVGSSMDQRAQSRVRRPSRRHKREARKYLAKLTTEPREIDGPDRWSLTFNSSLGAYEIEHRGPDTVHDLRIDFIDIRTNRQSQLNPRVRLPQLPADLPVTMQLGAPSRVRDYGVVLQWDDSFGVSQLERIRLADAYID